MQFPIIFILVFLSFDLFAIATDASVNELFKNYESLMEEKKIQLLHEVFSQNFIKENGGEKEFIEKIKQLSKSKDQKKMNISWYPGRKNKNLYFAKLFKESNIEFILIEENNKLKIDGTIGDSD